MDKFTVIRDTSEKKDHGWLFTESTHCTGTELFNLYTGDYSLKGLHEQKFFVIERKGSVCELVANMTQTDKWANFKDELERLEEWKHPFVVCEFPFRLLVSYPFGSNLPRHLWKKVRIRPQFILSRMHDIFFHFKTKFIFADTPEAAKQVALNLFKKAWLASNGQQVA